MKLLIIANGYPNKNDSQWGCFERDQAFALKKTGHEVSILYVDRRFRTYWRKIGFTVIKDQGINVYGMFLMPMRWAHFIPDKLHCWIVGKMFDRVYKIYAKENGKPDLIYAHFLFNIYYASILKDKYNIPLVGLEHWSALMKKSLSPLEKYQGIIAYSKADRLLAVSKSLQTQIKNHFGKESVVVYDMLGPEFLNTSVQHRKQESFTFITVGSLFPIKGYSMLIQAFAKSGLADKGCFLKIVGEGSERTTLEKQIHELDMVNSVSLLGRKTKNEILQLLGNSHVFVLSSYAETFGVACIEALSQGLPAVATKCGGPEEFINERNGVLVEPGNVDMMVQKLCFIYDNYDKYNPIAIAEECKKRFSPQTIAGQLNDIFESLKK